jgi:hypothetical protein
MDAIYIANCTKRARNFARNIANCTKHARNCAKNIANCTKRARYFTQNADYQYALKCIQKRPQNGPAGAFLAPSAPKTGPAELGFFIFPACGVIHRSQKLTF